MTFNFLKNTKHNKNVNQIRLHISIRSLCNIRNQFNQHGDKYLMYQDSTDSADLNNKKPIIEILMRIYLIQLRYNENVNSDVYDKTTALPLTRLEIC